jgi:hypothetical protein
VNASHLVIALLLIGLAWAGRLHAQTPLRIIAVKALGFSQTSGNRQNILNPSFGVTVLFGEPVSAGTVVQIRGPVTFTLRRTSPTEYDVVGNFTTEQMLDAALPDGNYTLAVSGGGAASNTAMTISSQPRITPVLVTNFEELQSLSSATFRISWQPIDGGTFNDLVTLNFYRDELNVLSLPAPSDSGSLNGRSISTAINNLPIVAGESLQCNLAFTRFSLTTSNNGATIVASATGFNVRFPVKRMPLTVPTIASQPRSVRIVSGTTAAFNVEANGTDLVYQWRRNSINIPGATTSTLILSQAHVTLSGDYSVVVSNSAGTVTSSSATLSMLSTPVVVRITNIAIRSSVDAGGPPLIVGFVVGGPGTIGAKPLLMRAVGPALVAFGVPGALADPRLQLFSGTTPIMENDNWGGDAQVSDASVSAGAFALSPTTSRDAALYLPSLTPGAYTNQITGVGGSSGTLLAEVYDATPPTLFRAATPRVLNVSARSTVGTGDNLLIAGFAIAGSTAGTVLIRALGPSLAGFGVAGTLNDPQLTLFSGSTRVLGNDDWGGATTLSTAFSSVGAFALGTTSRDAALLVTLPPGSYTAQVRGANNTTGVALVEVYEVP